MSWPKAKGWIVLKESGFVFKILVNFEVMVSAVSHCVVFSGKASAGK